MPSGFQQDQNQLSPVYYRIAIDMTGYPATDTNTGGGVTPNSADSFATLPTSTASGRNRARGNMRFRNIVNRLSNLTDAQVMDITITEATGDTQATALAFTVRYERDEFIKIGGTAADGVTAITTTALKIKDEVVRGILDSTTANVRMYDGNVGADTQQFITVTAPAAAADVFADVTVTTESNVIL